MDVTKLGVRITRARARLNIALAEERVDNSRPVKRRRLGNQISRSHSSTFAQTQTLGHDINYVNSVSSLEEELRDSVSIRSGGVHDSCCFSAGSVDKRKVLNLEEIISVKSETAERCNLDGNKSKPTRVGKVESGELESTTMKHLSVKVNSCSKVPVADKMPPESELEELFTAANEYLKKRFTDKYNYDIVNDIPLKGRFEWIQLKPDGK